MPGDLSISESDVSAPNAATVRSKLAEVAFGNRLIQNDFRGIVSEIIIGFALDPKWNRCSGNWGGWDFEHASGCHLEIKQSAALQTWAPPKKPSLPRFDIAERSCYWIGAQRVDKRGRHAHIYVFAHHPVADYSADHCDPTQWQFHVVPAHRLPPGKSISLKAVVLLAPAVPWTGLRDVIEQVRRLCGF